MSLHTLANHMATAGRGPDSMLVHMSPREVQSLQSLAEKNGGSLTINPHTGLPEAGFLDALLPIAAGFALGPAGFGLMSGMGAAAAVGGITALATGSLERGLMAGFGAFGGAGLGASLETLGAPALTDAAKEATIKTGLEASADTAAGTAGAETVANAAPSISPGTGTGITPPTGATPTGAIPTGAPPTIPGSAEYLNAEAANTGLPSINNPTLSPESSWPSAPPAGDYSGPATRLSDYHGMKPVGAGLDKLLTNDGALGDFASANKKYLLAAGVPMLLTPPKKGAVHAPISPGMIRRFSYDPTGYTSQGSYLASEDKGMAQGGIVALANGGGIAHFDGSNGSYVDEDYHAPPAVTRVPVAPIGSYVDEDYHAPPAVTYVPVAPSVVAPVVTAPSAAAPVVTAPSAASTTVDPNAISPSVEELYKTYAQRGSDPEGLKFWTQQFGDTIDPNEINAFKNSVAEARAQGTENKLSQAAANSMVQNMYRNTLNRDAETSGMNYWSDMLQHSDDPTKVYQNFINSAKANTELGNFKTNDIGYTQAVSPYQGYMSTDTGSNADEWVRNVLNREVTDADRNKQWYKDMANVTTTAQTKKAYNDFLADTGAKTNLDFMAASQLSPLKKKALATATGIGTDTGNLPPGVSGGGNTVVNPNGTITTRPNIPGIPEGGFTGMGNLRDVYTAGGGSLGYLPYAPKTAAEHEALYNTMTGGSKQAYDYLTGKTPYSPVPYTATGEIQKPYIESVMNYPAADTSTQRFLFNPKTRSFTPNPDYVPVTYVKGEKTYGLSTNDIAAQFPDVPKTDYEKWLADNNVTYDQLAKALKISPAEARKKYPLKKNDNAVAGVFNGVANTISNGSGEGEGYTPPPRIANGGLIALAGGGMPMRSNLGGYSDGGQLLKGPGDGVSDSIPASIEGRQPAQLANDEFVIPARIVSELGNGSTDAGAKKLYQMMDRVQHARKKSIGKNNVAVNSRADKYLPA